MSWLYPLIPFQTCLRQKGKSAWQKNVRTTFSRFSPSAVLPPSLLPVSSPPAPVKLGNLSKRERKRTQTNWSKTVPLTCSVATFSDWGRKFWEAVSFCGVTFIRSQERCHLAFGHVSVLPTRVMPWPWCTWVFGLCCGTETYCCSEASWSDTADFPSPHFILWFVFIA